jgi:hypothetical protein
MTRRFLVMSVPQSRPWFFAAAALFSGASLVAAIVFRAPLGVTLSVFGMLAAIGIAYRWRQTPPAGRAIVKTRVRVGALAGLLGTFAYDLSRYMIVVVTRMHYRPFETLVLFGYSLAGQQISRAAAYALGAGFHLLNGTCFAIAYCLVFGGKNWKFAVLWALALEAAMFSIYPTWLNLAAVKMEFTIVSLCGHLAYGTIVGITSQARLAAIQHAGDHRSGSS